MATSAERQVPPVPDAGEESSPRTKAKGGLFDGLMIQGSASPTTSLGKTSSHDSAAAAAASYEYTTSTNGPAVDEKTPKVNNARRIVAQPVLPVVPGLTATTAPGGANVDTNHTTIQHQPSPRLQQQQPRQDDDDEDNRPLNSAPVTDKLLGLLDGNIAAPSAPAASSTSVRPSPPQEKSESVKVINDDNSNDSNNQQAQGQEGGSWLGGWFGGASSPPPPTPSKEQTEKIEEEDAKPPATESSPSGKGGDQPKTPAGTAPATADDAKETPPEASASAAASKPKPPPPEVVETDDSTNNEDEAAVAAGKTATGGVDEEEEKKAISPKQPMNEAEQKAFDEAFHHVERSSSAMTVPGKPSRNHRGVGRVADETPIPHSDVCLRLLRKFAMKTRPKIVTTYGGTKPRSFMSYIFGSKEDAPFVAYRDFLQILYDGDTGDIIDDHPSNASLNDDSDRVVEGVLGATGDDMARAREAVAAFVYVIGMWGHASSRYLDEKVRKTQEEFSELLSASIDAATDLVAHGCLDGVKIEIGIPEPSNNGKDGGGSNGQWAVYLISQSVFNSDLTLINNELAAMKFLLTTGCRVTPGGHALLRGSHLLQTIRTLYHVYLTTESTPNKTTARAALQQLVTSVFTRVIQSDAEGRFEKTADNFPSENHRDAFLVLRSICKLSMRSLPDPKTGMHSHVGLQTSGSSDTWDGSKPMGPDTERAKGLSPSSKGSGAAGITTYGGEDAAEAHPDTSREHAQLLLTAAIHPALESKLLALDLLLYVLQNTDYSRGFIQRCGHQFQAAIRNYLCVSLLKNCTSNDTRVVNVSLRIFVPLVRNFRTVLKNEIEAFVTNVFFVILDSANTPAEHKSLVVKTFDEICSDPSTLAEIFLNYDCDLSAVDLFHRIVNTLSKVSRAGFQEPKSTGMGFMGGPSAARMEKFRNENRELRLDAMRAMRQVLASLHASIVEPLERRKDVERQLAAMREEVVTGYEEKSSEHDEEEISGKQNLVEIYDSKKKRRAEESEVVLRFNQKPSAGISFAAKCGHVDGEDPGEVARYLLNNKDIFDKASIGEYLGREPDYQKGFSIKVLHEYVRSMDFTGLPFDEAIRFFLSGFRLPGEAQKIDRIMEKFAERYTDQNPEVFPTADSAFILAFSVIMLNTDLHNPAIKEDRRMTKEGFIRNNRGICDGQDLPEELLTMIFDRIRENPISLKEDDEARERAGEGKAKASSLTGLPAGLSPASFFSSHYDEMDRARESNYQKERDHIVRTTESLLKRRRHSTMDPKSQSKLRHGRGARHPKFVRTEDSGLRDEYVSPMFEVAWGPALASFSTAMESANGTMGALIAIASDEELELAAENAAETIEVCLTGFRFAICTAGLCGNDTARDAYVLALSRFSQLGTGVLLEPRHVRCIQTLMSLAKDDGELLGNSWQYVFRALSEINRFHQLFHLMARNDRAAAAAAARRQRRMEERERRRLARQRRRQAAEDGSDVEDMSDSDANSETDDSLAESDLFSDPDDLGFEEDMDAKAIDESNARVVYDAVSEGLIEAIYQRSSTFSPRAVKDFVTMLCQVSQNEISAGGLKGDLNQVSYRQQHALLNQQFGGGADQFHHTQPNIYNLQKLVEVTHYNMESRPRLIFSELWSIVAEHLTSTALHSNTAIAMYAVDSFRQLSIQYLQRQELEVFEFQRRFLKPLEVVMARSANSSTKELLLNCVDRIIHVFKVDKSKTVANQKGGLKSGWVPILIILGLGGRDNNPEICSLSFKILTSEIKSCLSSKDLPDVLLSEHFLDTVNALLMYVRGPHEQFSLQAFDQLSLLARYLDDDSVALPQLRRKMSTSGALADADGQQELELWWPILLALSESVGDDRVAVRSKALKTLVDIIVGYFFPPAHDKKQGKRSARTADIQTLQLIFRGILFPIVEFAELGNQDGPGPSLPSDFERFLSQPNSTKNMSGDVSIDEMNATGWLETTFDPFMDSCVMLCLQSMRAFGDESIVDEVFAVLNACLLADSGHLAVKGLQRLEQFITSDLDSSAITDDIWATVSHMLRRCLAVRGLPRPPQVISSDQSVESKEETAVTGDEEYAEAVKEFIVEDGLLSDRRYVGGNATNVIGLILSSDTFSIGLRWRLFLIAGLGHAIVEWERAASILSKHKGQVDEYMVLPPDYNETALYGRKWMNRFLLQIASMKEVAQASPDGDVKTNRYAAGQKLVLDETQRLLAAFLKSESVASEYQHPQVREAIYERLTELVSELLSGYHKMEDDHLKDMAWIDSVLLGSCIQSKNQDIRLSVQKLVQRTAPSQKPYPSPSKTPSTDSTGNAVHSKESDDGSKIAPGTKKESDGATSEVASPKTPTSEDEAIARTTPERTSSGDSWNPMSWFGGSAAAESTSPAASAEEDGGSADQSEAVKTEGTEAEGEKNEKVDETVVKADALAASTPQENEVAVD